MLELQDDPSPLKTGAEVTPVLQQSGLLTKPLPNCAVNTSSPVFAHSMALCLR